MPPDTLEFEEPIAVLLKEVEALSMLPHTPQRHAEIDGLNRRIESIRGYAVDTQRLLAYTLIPLFMGCAFYGMPVLIREVLPSFAPAIPVASDSNPVELGVTFSARPGTISAIQFYRGAPSDSGSGAGIPRCSRTRWTTGAGSAASSSYVTFNCGGCPSPRKYASQEASWAVRSLIR